MSSGKDILAGLNEAQRYAVTLGPGPVLVIAGAGSGKTRTLTHRVAYLVEQGADPESVLLLTFTRRAAAEMLSRARRLHPACNLVSGGTFHSLCFRLLRRHGRSLGLPPHFTVMDQPDAESMVRGAINELGLKSKGDRRFPRPRTIVSLISKARNLEMDLAETIEVFASHLADYSSEILAAAQSYQAGKRAQHLVDYDDLLFMVEELLLGDAGLRRSLRQDWPHLLVDEYQDTNAVQARLVELLSGRKGDVMVVGDDAQSIYGFRGARLRNILEFPERFPTARLVKLEQNYRSTQLILDLSNAVIAQAAQRYEKNLFSKRGSGPRPALLRPRDDRDQTRQVASRLEELLQEGEKPEDLAVLFRAGRDSFDLELELTSLRIPFIKYGGFRFLEAAHIKDALAHLRVVANPGDFLSWQRILMLLPKVGPKTAQAVIAHLVQTADPQKYLSRLQSAPQIKTMPALGELALLLEEISAPDTPPLAAAEAVLEYYRPLCRENFEDYPRRLEDLGEVATLARAYDDLAEFMAEVVIEPPLARSAEAGGGRVTLSTVHSAKGLEWRHVFVLWLSEGRFPSGASLMDPEALEEERRLLYVACTRAGQSLTLLSPRQHYRHDSGLVPVRLSRFLEDLPPSLLQSESAGPVFPVGAVAPGPAAVELPPGAPASRGSRKQPRPFAVGIKVRHAKFGPGKVMGYKGEDKVFVHFARHGLKTLILKYAKLEEV